MVKRHYRMVGEESPLDKWEEEEQMKKRNEEEREGIKRWHRVLMWVAVDVAVLPLMMWGCKSCAESQYDNAKYVHDCCYELAPWGWSIVSFLVWFIAFILMGKINVTAHSTHSWGLDWHRMARWYMMGRIRHSMRKIGRSFL